jgi:hypothetical protein
MSMAIRADAGKPVDPLSAPGAPPFPVHFFQPRFQVMVLDVLQLINKVFMVGDTIDDMDVFKIFQSLAGEIGALKAPGYSVLTGALSETGSALDTRWHQIVRMAAIAAHFFNGEVHVSGPLLQLSNVILLLGEVAWARSAVDSANTSQLPGIFLHGEHLL